MSEVKPLILYSRSAVLADWSCKRKRYLNYEVGGRGITPAASAYELYFGTMIHDGLAAIVAGVEIDAICEAAVLQLRNQLLDGAGLDDKTIDFANEQCALGEGLLRGFHKHIWPRVLDEYEVVCSEQEMTYEHDGLTFMAKPDLVLRHRESNDLVYFEYKTTSSIKDQWINSWNTAVQVHSTIKAIERTFGEPVSHVIVQGLHKGYISQYDRQESIFCYYFGPATESPILKVKPSYTYRAGLRKYPVWKLAGGSKEWVAGMPDTVLAKELPQTPPIFINHDLVDAFFKQRGYREHEIREGRDLIEAALEEGKHTIATALLDKVFPQSFENCSPGWGKGCQYRKLCFGKHADPLQVGFEVRHSHHPMEEEYLNAAENSA